MITAKESADALRLLLTSDGGGLSDEEQIQLLVMACANLIEKSMLAITSGNVQEAKEGIRRLMDDMINNVGREGLN